MDELQIVELIGNYTARLSPAGRELWDNYERLVETVRPGEDIGREIWHRGHASRDLSPGDWVACMVLLTLSEGLHRSRLAEDSRGDDWGQTYRRAAVIKAAYDRARVEGGAVTPPKDMTLDEALILLRAH